MNLSQWQILVSAWMELILLASTVRGHIVTHIPSSFLISETATAQCYFVCRKVMRLRVEHIRASHWCQQQVRVCAEAMKDHRRGIFTLSQQKTCSTLGALVPWWHYKWAWYHSRPLHCRVRPAAKRYTSIFMKSFPRLGRWYAHRNRQGQSFVFNFE